MSDVRKQVRSFSKLRPDRIGRNGFKSNANSIEFEGNQLTVPKCSYYNSFIIPETNQIRSASHPGNSDHFVELSPIVRDTK